MPLFLIGCFPVDFQEGKRPLRTKSMKSPIKVGKRPVNEGKQPIKAVVLVGISVGCLMGCFRATPPWRKAAPLKRPIKRCMSLDTPSLKLLVDLVFGFRGRFFGGFLFVEFFGPLCLDNKIRKLHSLLLGCMVVLSYCSSNKSSNQGNKTG